MYSKNARITSKTYKTNGDKGTLLFSQQKRTTITSSTVSGTRNPRENYNFADFLLLIPSGVSGKSCKKENLMKNVVAIDNP